MVNNIKYIKIIIKCLKNLLIGFYKCISFIILLIMSKVLKNNWKVVGNGLKMLLNNGNRIKIY
jgi:hypothetical protein